MSSPDFKDYTRKRLYFFVGLVIVVVGILFAILTQFMTTCGLDQYNLPVCLINPTIQSRHLFGGINPLVFDIVALFLVVIGLFFVYLGVNFNKYTNKNEQTN